MPKYQNTTIPNILIAMTYYTGMIIDNCKTLAERLGNQATYKQLHFKSMEAYGDHGNAPELQWHQERQNMMLYLIESINDGGTSSTMGLGKNRTHSVNKEERRIVQFSYRTGEDSGWSESLRCFVSMTCMLMKHVDEWKPD